MAEATEEVLHGALHAAYAVTRRVLPGALRSHALRINIGELLAVAVKPGW